MFVHSRNPLQLPVVAVLIMSVAMPVAHAEESADDPTFDTLFQPVKVNAKWKDECSACHIAFPPGLLRAESWIKIMAGLDNHFGVDASLPARDNNEITAFLVKNASTRWRNATTPLRITETSWFKDVHYIHQLAWNDPIVKSASNCFACHKHAEHGDFYGGGGGCGGATLCHGY